LAGWIKLHRKILDNPIFLKPDLYQLFSYCLLRANHNETKIIWNGKEEILEKGCFITGRKKLSKETGQTESGIFRRLKVLQTLKIISVKSNNRFSVVKVLNYSVYQGEENESEQPANNQRTTSEQLANTDNTLKNLKNEKKSISSCRTNKFADEAIEISLASELYDLILLNNPNTKEPNFQTWARSIDLMIRVDNRSVSEIQEVIRWSQKDSFWQANILSTKKLREKYDQLTMKMKSVKRTDKPPKTPSDKYDKFYL
jgi:hypothetical protein